jgi:hypothetical protein
MGLNERAFAACSPDAGLLLFPAVGSTAAAPVEALGLEAATIGCGADKLAAFAGSAATTAAIGSILATEPLLAPDCGVDKRAPLTALSNRRMPKIVKATGGSRIV